MVTAKQKRAKNELKREKKKHRINKIKAYYFRKGRIKGVSEIYNKAREYQRSIDKVQDIVKENESMKLDMQIMMNSLLDSSLALKMKETRRKESTNAILFHANKLGKERDYIEDIEDKLNRIIKDAARKGYYQGKIK